MSSQYGPIDISCDAPPFPVVEACEGLGFRYPADVRWSRLSHFLEEREGGAGLHPWKWFMGKGLDREKTCHCGRALPILERYAFTFITERVAEYLLGQCPRCRTIFWEEG